MKQLAQLSTLYINLNFYLGIFYKKFKQYILRETCSILNFCAPDQNKYLHQQQEAILTDLQTNKDLNNNSFMIRHQSPHYQMMNVMNRNNRNCTAMVQPKNNVAANNTLHMSEMSQQASGGTGQSSRNPNIVSEHNRNDDINNNQIPPMYNTYQINHEAALQTAKIYKSTEYSKPMSYDKAQEVNYQVAARHRGTKTSQPENSGGPHDSSSDLVMHSTSLHQGFEGAARGANHSALMDLSVSSNRYDLHGAKAGTNKLRATAGPQEGVGNNQASQTSLRSHRNGQKRSGRQNQGQGRAQPDGIASAISPANRSAVNSKEPSVHQQNYSSHGQRGQDNTGTIGRTAVGVGGQRGMAGSASGSSEKYAGKQASQASGSVPHQIIVNGFPNSKSNGTAPGGRSYHNSGAMSSGGSRAAPLNVNRHKSNSGSSSNAKNHEHMTVMKSSKNSTSGTLNGMIGLMTSGGHSTSGTDSQLRGTIQRKKTNQSTAGKLSTYTTDQKGKTARQDLHGSGTPAPQSASHSSHGLNSMRNYSGSLQKAPIVSGSIYKTQRGYYQYSKISSRGAKPAAQEHVLHNTRTAKVLGVSGTVASESTALSRSGRSGEGERTGANHTFGTQSATSGIPLHPKLMQHKNACMTHNASGRLLPAQKAQGGGSLTQNQTPNPLSYSNSQTALNRQRQFYNSNQNPHAAGTIQQRESAHPKYELGQHLESSNVTGENVSSVEKAAGSSSENDTSQRSKQMNQKIQRFDFRDYDSEEKLRIKNTAGEQEIFKASDEEGGQFKQADQGTSLRLADPEGARREGSNLSSGGNIHNITQDSAPKPIATIPEHVLRQQAAIKAKSGERTGGSYQEEATESHSRQQSTQKMTSHTISELVGSSQKHMAQSKSTGKVSRSDRTTELTHGGGSHSSAPDDVVQIDDGKLKQYQQLIQNVKFQNDEISVLQGHRAGERATRNGDRAPESSAIDKSMPHMDSAKEGHDEQFIGSKNKQSQFKSLHIEIPEIEEGQEQISQDQSVKGRRQNSSRMAGSEDEQMSHSLQCGEENLLPSTEKKNAHSKISAQRIPKSGGVGGLLKTGTHLISNMKQHKNIFLGKMPCNSTKNNNRYSNQILDEEFQPLFQKDKSSGRQRQPKGHGPGTSSETGADPNQETPKIVYKDRSSIASKILQEKVSFEKRISPDKGPTQSKGKKGSGSKKESSASAKKSMQLRSTLMHRGTSQGPPVNKNRENRIAAEVIMPSASSASKTSPGQGKGSSVPRLNGASTTKPNAQQAPANALSKCIGIRSGSESNVKTNSGQILNAVAGGAHGMTNMESIAYNMQDQRLGIQPAHKIIIPNDDPTKTSNKRTGIVRAYAANTNQGLVRNYNEDRVSIITNLLPPKTRTDITPDKWPRCSYFGIYDGHGGSLCADFLRDNLHQFVIMESCFPANPKEAIVRGFEKAEKAFMEKIYNPQTRELKDKSGSCAIVVLIVQEICYVANVGDSRAVLSCEGGQKVYPLSLDHKPGEDCETKRIRAAGGQIYYRTTKNEVVQYDENKIDKVQQMTLAGPLRVLPGRLSVARTFGDPEAKIPELGGNPHVVIHNPDVKSFQIKKDHDFIALGCDGIFDKMSNSDAVMCVWKAAHDNKYHQNVKGQAQDVHKLCGMGVEYILKNSLLRRSLDNVTVVVIGFSNLKHEVFGHQPAALQFKSDGDSGTDNQLKTQSQVYPPSQQLQQPKKQNIVANSHRERGSKQGSKGPDKHDSGKTLERNRSANLPREASTRQSIQMKYQQITQSNKKLSDNVSKASLKHSSTGHHSANNGTDSSGKSQKKRALTSTSTGGLKDKRQSPSASTEPSNSFQIKKQYNLQQNISTGHLHKPNASYTARPSHGGGQKEGAKPPLSNYIKYNNNVSHQISSQNTTPTNSMGQKASSSQVIGGGQHASQKNSLKAPRYSGNYFSVKQHLTDGTGSESHTDKQMSQTCKNLNFNI